MNAEPTDIRRSSFYFADGNVVLIAGDLAFKVHQGQLGRHSEVFEGLFAIPQPTPYDGQDAFDGVPSVVLHDAPEDVLCFLRAIYDGLYFSKSRRVDEFTIVASVLRLSTKYMVEPLRQRCLQRLSQDWPQSLAEWDAREKESTDAQGRYVPRDRCPHPILVIELCIELGLDHILPSAFYDLCRYGPSKIAGGTTVPVRESADPSSPPSTAPAPQLLSRDLLVRVFKGREAAQRSINLFIANSLQSRAPSTGCTSPENNRFCRESFYFIMLNILRSVGGIACGRDADPLYTLVQAADMLTRTDFSDGVTMCGLKMCEPCKADFRETVEDARNTAWKNIPEWFGLHEGAATECKKGPTAEVDMRDEFV